MKLRVRFLQLPILFDAARLEQEVSRIDESAWRPHPKKFAGNDALPLITTDGDPLSDARAGKMGPTEHLLACPYLMQVLGALGATWGRSRLMRLSGASEVTPHVDTDYYWRDHMRVHVPIVTQPTVRFNCGGEAVNMAAGQCWVFDTWSLHSVQNDATRARIHLVADTVGGGGLLNLIENGRAPNDDRTGWSPTLAAPQPGPAPTLAYESRNSPEVMTPWELKDHLGFLLSEAAPGDVRVGPISQTLNRLRVNWHALWAQSGDDPAARPQYAQHLSQTWAQLESLDINSVVLKNQMSLGLCLKALVIDSALSNAANVIDQDQRIAPGAKAAPPSSATPPAPLSSRPSADRPSGRDPVYDRPVFIVSSPRSGSSLLFETLSAAQNLHTIGGESHGLIEAIPALSPSAHGWDSNRLTKDDADPQTAARLRQDFWAALRDRTGARPATAPIRMLEKTPKNALRIPFLAAAFPEAHFIYLYRAPGPTLASMMEAWSSGRFRTYPQLPGWTGPDWSLLLTPGWRDLAGAPLEQIVAHQWSVTTKTMLADLSALPADRWCAVDYDAFIARPQAQIAGLCQAMQMDWDTPLGPTLPLSRHTVSTPRADKWRAQEALIERSKDLWGPANDLALNVRFRAPAGAFAAENTLA